MTATSPCWRATWIAVALIGALTMTPKAAVAEMPPALYKLGLPAAAGAVSVMVSSADLSVDQQDSEALQLVVRYVVKNISFDPVPIGKIPGMHLLDPDGGTHDPAESPSLSSDSASAAGGLEPGGEIGRTAVFKVAKDQFNKATWRLLIGGPYGPRVTLQ